MDIHEWELHRTTLEKKVEDAKRERAAAKDSNDEAALRDANTALANASLELARYWGARPPDPALLPHHQRRLTHLTAVLLALAVATIIAVNVLGAG